MYSPGVHISYVLQWFQMWFIQSDFKVRTVSFTV